MSMRGFGPPDPLDGKSLIDCIDWQASAAQVSEENNLRIGPGDCPACDGMGFYWKIAPTLSTVRCHHCHGSTMKPERGL